MTKESRRLRKSSNPAALAPCTPFMAFEIEMINSKGKKIFSKGCRKQLGVKEATAQPCFKWAYYYHATFLNSP